MGHSEFLLITQPMPLSCANPHHLSGRYCFPIFEPAAATLVLCLPANITYHISDSGSLDLLLDLLCANHSSSLTPSCAFYGFLPPHVCESPATIVACPPDLGRTTAHSDCTCVGGCPQPKGRDHKGTCSPQFLCSAPRTNLFRDGKLQ